MKTRQVYQTLENRDNPDEIERSGPFHCSRNDAWLGHGYYFWESFVSNAHWWGAKTYPNGYIICQASYVDDGDKCLDLTNEGILELRGAISLMQKKGINVSRGIYFKRIVEFLKEIGHFHWEAVKAAPKNTRQDLQDSPKILFSDKYAAYIDLCSPPIQICFFSKKALCLSGYKIIFPDEYVNGFGV